MWKSNHANRGVDEDSEMSKIVEDEPPTNLNLEKQENEEARKTN